MSTLFNAVDIALMAERKKLEAHLELLINEPKNYESQVTDVVEVLKRIAQIDTTIKLWNVYTTPKQIIKENVTSEDNK